MKITLCGSSKYRHHIDEWNHALTKRGHTVYSLGFTAGLTPTPKEKRVLDLVHFSKIMESQSIVIVNSDDYIGDSTCNEIIYAVINNKCIFAVNKPQTIRDWGIGPVIIAPAQCLLGVSIASFGDGGEWQLCGDLESSRAPNSQSSPYGLQQSPLGPDRFQSGG